MTHDAHDTAAVARSAAGLKARAHRGAAALVLLVGTKRRHINRTAK